MVLSGAVEWADPVVRVLISVYTFILVSSSAAWGLERALRKDLRSIRQAINGWWWVSVPCGLAVLLGPTTMVALCTGVSYVALREHLELCPPEWTPPLIRRLLLLSIPLHYGLLATGRMELFLSGMLLWGFLVIPAAGLWVLPLSSYGAAVGRLTLAQVPCVLGVSLLCLPWFMPGFEGDLAKMGPVLFLLLVTMMGDATQYFWGKVLGRTPITPTLSPKKTWEGLVGGVLTTALTAAAAGPLLLPFGSVMCFVLGLALGVAGFAGDLVMSGMKRSAGVKDSGQVIPGQGGMLDRVDSLLYCAPLFFVVLFLSR